MSQDAIPWIGIGVATLMVLLSPRLKQPARDYVHTIGVAIIFGSGLLSVILDGST